MSLPVVPRRRVQRDVEDAIDYFVREGGATVALDFVDQLEAAYGAMSTHPASGSPRYAFELDIPGLRSWPVRRFPYLVFYMARDDRIDIWRVLHMKNDIPVWMREGD